MKKLFLLASAIFSLNADAQLPSYIPINGLVVYYPCNGNAADVSGNNYNGTVSGANLTNDRFGNVNSAYNFVGTLGSVITSTPNLPIGNSSRAISVWVKTSSLTGGSSGTNLNILVNWGLNSVNKMSEIDIDLGIAKFNTYALGISSATNISDNTWHNILSTYDNSISTLKIYIDGVLKGTSTGTLNTSSSQLYIGERNGEINLQKMDGIIDDIGIWNRALTQQEITVLYNSVNCSNNLTISPSNNQLQTGAYANFNATTTDPNPSYVWQSDFGQGFQTLNNFGAYSGVNTSNLSISNVQLANHLQPIRVIATSGTCIDTSNVATINISDTCIVTINDTITTLISVTDTLIINSTITSLTPPNNTNTIKVFPNPTNDHITINYGNFAAMNGYTLKITNALGQVVFTSPINQQISYLDLSTWGGNGIYFIQIINPQNNTIENRKIVLQ